MKPKSAAIVIAALLAGGALTAAAHPEAEATKMNVESLRRTSDLYCVFGKGATGDWAQPKDARLAAREPKIELLEGGMPPLTFVGIDRNNRTAYTVGNNGSSKVRVEVSGLDQLTFVERPGGGVQITTVYAVNNGFVAVHSRHAAGAGFGAPMPSQYYGRCSLHPGVQP